jgi:hypothetical protein
MTDFGATCSLTSSHKPAEYAASAVINEVNALSDCRNTDKRNVKKREKFIFRAGILEFQFAQKVSLPRAVNMLS